MQNKKIKCKEIEALKYNTGSMRCVCLESHDPIVGDCHGCHLILRSEVRCLPYLSSTQYQVCESFGSPENMNGAMSDDNQPSVYNVTAAAAMGLLEFC